jgi:hypothetical protein
MVFTDNSKSAPFAQSTPISSYPIMASAVEIESLDGVPIVPIMGEQFTARNHTSQNEEVDDVTVGAGIAAGSLGLLVGGPVLAILTGFGTAYAATQSQEGAARDVARALGQIALQTRDKALELDRRHNLVVKGKQAVSEGWTKLKELDQKHQILEKGKAFVVWSWTQMAEQNRKHRILERAIEATGKALSFIFVKLVAAFQQARNTDANPQSNQPATISAAIHPRNLESPLPPHKAIVH